MKRSSSTTKKNDIQLWKKYLTTIHRKQGVEPNSSATQKFWKNYEDLIRQSWSQRVVPLPPVQPKASVGQLYQEIFLKYWNGVAQTIAYDQQVNVSLSPKDLIKFNPASSAGCLSMFGVFMFVSWVANIFDMSFGSYMFTVFLVFSILHFSFGVVKDYRAYRHALANPKGKPPNTIHYTYLIQADHLIFTKIDRHHRVKKTARLEYAKVKSLTIQNNELRLKSVYRSSLNELWEDRQIKENFCIPVSMPQGKAVTDFLREILLFNKAQRN